MSGLTQTFHYCDVYFSNILLAPRSCN